MSVFLTLADLIQRVLGRIASLSGAIMLAMAAIICVDVVTRRFGLQIPGLGSTRLQELEWHFHTALFALWIGYGYVRNVHVRVDVAVGGLAERRRMWIELFCCLLLALPFAVIVTYFGSAFAYQSFQQMESSPSPVGLPMRWIPKTLVAVGFCLLTLAILAVLARLVVALFGRPELAARAAGEVRI